MNHVTDKETYLSWVAEECWSPAFSKTTSTIFSNSHSKAMEQVLVFRLVNLETTFHQIKWNDKGWNNRWVRIYKLREVLRRQLTVSGTTWEDTTKTAKSEVFKRSKFNFGSCCCISGLNSSAWNEFSVVTSRLTLSSAHWSSEWIIASGFQHRWEHFVVLAVRA